MGKAEPTDHAGKTAWKKLLKGSSPCTWDRIATVSRRDGERGVWPGTSVIWALWERGIGSHPQYRQREPQDGCGLKEESHGVKVASYRDTSWDLISLGWVTWRRVYDFERPKTPDDSNPLNYRLIALTSHIGKLMERMVNERLMHFVEEKGLLENYQSGFKKGKKHQYDELEGFHNYNPLINDDKDVNNRPNINNQLITP